MEGRAGVGSVDCCVHWRGGGAAGAAAGRSEGRLDVLDAGGQADLVAVGWEVLRQPHACGQEDLRNVGVDRRNAVGTIDSGDGTVQRGDCDHGRAERHVHSVWMGETWCSGWAQTYRSRKC